MFIGTDLIKNAFESLSIQERERLCKLGLEKFKDKYYGSAKGYGINRLGIDRTNHICYGFEINIFDATKDHLVPDYFEVLDGNTTYLIPIKKTIYRDEAEMHSLDTIAEVEDSGTDEKSAMLPKFTKDKKSSERLATQIANIKFEREELEKFGKKLFDAVSAAYNDSVTSIQITESPLEIVLRVQDLQQATHIPDFFQLDHGDETINVPILKRKLVPVANIKLEGEELEKFTKKLFDAVRAAYLCDVISIEIHESPLKIVLGVYNLQQAENIPDLFELDHGDETINVPILKRKSAPIYAHTAQQQEPDNKPVITRRPRHKYN